MSLEGSSSSSSFQREPLQTPAPVTNPPARDIKGSISDGPVAKADKMKTIATDNILAPGSSSSLAVPAKLSGRGKLMAQPPIAAVIATLRAYQDKQKSLKKEGYAEIGQLILHNRHALYKAVQKDSELGPVLESVGRKYKKEALKAGIKLESINKVRKEISKINRANSLAVDKQKDLQKMDSLLKTLLANYNQLLIHVPTDQLMRQIGKFLNHNLAWFNSQSVESAILGRDQLDELLIQLHMMLETLELMSPSDKPPLAEKLENLLLQILPEALHQTQAPLKKGINLLPAEMQKIIYTSLPSSPNENYLASLATLRSLIAGDNPQFGYECLAEWISMGRLPLSSLSVEELRGIAPHLTHANIDEMRFWPVDYDFNSFMDSCPKLTSLEIGQDRSDLTEFTAKQFQKLKHLKLHGMGGVQILPEMASLQSLDCQGIRTLPHLPALKSLKVNFNIDSDGLAVGIGPNDPELHAIASQLTHLEIKADNRWNDETFNHFIQKCTHLESLEIESDTITKFSPRMSHLQSLIFANCPSLETISGDMPALRSLALWECANLNQAELLALAPQLEDVRIGDIAAWKDADYNTFIQACGKLKKCFIRSDKVTELPARVGQVTDLSVSGCKNLKTIPPLPAVVTFAAEDCPALDDLPSMPLVKTIIR